MSSRSSYLPRAREMSNHHHHQLLICQYRRVCSNVRFLLTVHVSACVCLTVDRRHSAQHTHHHRHRRRRSWFILSIKRGFAGARKERERRRECMAVSHRKFSICSAVCANSTVELEILIYPAAATFTAAATAADSDSDSDGRGTAIFGTALISLRCTAAAAAEN